jgi:hypothetical protein
MLPEALADAIRQTTGSTLCDRLATMVRRRWFLERATDTTSAGHASGVPGMLQSEGPGGGCRWVFPGSQTVSASAATGFVAQSATLPDGSDCTGTILGLGSYVVASQPASFDAGKPQRPRKAQVASCATQLVPVPPSRDRNAPEATPSWGRTWPISHGPKGRG